MIGEIAQLRTLLTVILTGLGFLLNPSGAFCEDYPSRPIHFLVGFAAGGANDVVARVIGQQLSEILGVSIVVENHVGANGTIAMRQTAQAAPDGYTMALAGATVMAINPHTTRALGYDPIQDFIGITTVSKSPIIIAVNPSVPAANLRELAEVARAGHLTMGSAGVGGIAHLTIEMFNTAAKVKTVQVPYNGGAQASTDVIAGHTQSLAMDLAPILGPINDGKMRAIAVVGEKRSIMLPNVPTAIEQGFPGMSADNWYAIVVPAKTPPAIVDKLYAAAAKADSSPKVKDVLAKTGAETTTLASPQEFGPFLRSEIDRWGAVVKAAGLEK